MLYYASCEHILLFYIWLTKIKVPWPTKPLIRPCALQTERSTTYRDDGKRRSSSHLMHAFDAAEKPSGWAITATTLHWLLMSVSDMELGHLGHLSRPGHRVIILTRCETRALPVSKKCPKYKTYT